MSDEKMEKEIVDKGLTYPRITNDEIVKKMEGVKYDCHIVPGTTTTVVTAVLPMAHLNFTLGTDIMACVDPRNFNAELGEKYGKEKLEGIAKNELWKLEGYRLAYEIANEPKGTKERVVIELEELTAKFGGLSKFLDSSAASKLEPEQHTLLVKQLTTMGEYITILDSRLNTWAEI